MGSAASTGRSYDGRRRSRTNRRTRYRRYNAMDTTVGRVRDPDDADTETIKVRGADFNIAANARQHHTDDFDIMESKKILVIRRGQPFEITMMFDRDYDSKHDDLRIRFTYGNNPSIGNGTRKEFKLSEENRPRSWSALIKSKNGVNVNLEVMTPPHCQVGKWEMTVDAVKRTGTETTVYRKKLETPIYILFNPWCKEDEVYMEDESLKNEYILSETGVIFVGTATQISARSWNFGQFTDKVLDAALYLIEESSLEDRDKGDPILVSREISALVNSPDDGGVLVGNWSGNYKGGVSPGEWPGSVGILEQYYDTKQPVKFGQCWVFSGIVTTVCRAIGIPARSITNFASAHDTDANIYIDMYYDEEGRPIENLNKDSVWNFHVWNDVWMARPDLPPGYGGWQAIDATPQEKSSGIYCMGPMSLQAIKQGQTRFSFDGPFVFSECNGDMVYWSKRKTGGWTRHIDRNRIGQKMSTKMPNSDQREDVTNQYKFPEGSAENKSAFERAVHNTYDDEENETKDVHFTMKMDEENLYLGDDATVKLKMKNTSRETRNISGTMIVQTIYYTGRKYQHLKSVPVSARMQAGTEQEVEVEIPFKEYYGNLADHCYIQVESSFFVDETSQHHTSKDNFRLRKSHLELQAATTGRVGEKISVRFSFVNRLPIPLTGCKLRVEGGGLKPVIHAESNVPGRQRYTGSFDITFRRRGRKEISAYFNSTEVFGITGTHKIDVQ